MDKQEERVLPPPNGTSGDWSHILAGEHLSVADAKRKENALESAPGDLAIRLMLLGFYGHRASDQDKYFNHMLWMIDERPSDNVCFYLGHSYYSRAFTWTKARVREASSRWSHQARKHFHDARVLCNAASFFQSHDEQMSERLYRRAKRVDRALALPARQLAYQYRFLASKAPKNKRPELVRLALQEADEALRRRDQRGERVGILTEFTPTAIKFGHLVLARKFAKRLQYYGEVFYLWNQYAYLYLAWLDLRESRFRGLKLKLERLRMLFEEEPSHVASCSAALSFVNDALSMGEKEIAQDILNVLIFGSRDDEKRRQRAELNEWLASIRDGRKPKLNVLKKRMSRLF